MPENYCIIADVSQSLIIFIASVLRTAMAAELARALRALRRVAHRRARVAVVHHPHFRCRTFSTTCQRHRRQHD